MTVSGRTLHHNYDLAEIVQASLFCDWSFVPDWVQEDRKVQNDGYDQYDLLQSLNQILRRNDVVADAEVERVLHGQKGKGRGSVHVVKEEEGKKQWGKKERGRQKVNEQVIFVQC